MPLHQECEDLKRDLLRMGTLVEEALGKCVASLMNRREELAEEVVEGDRQIDALENTIDERCTQILALQQPVANDLRLILTVMKANDELERMGDHAKNVAKSAKKLAHHPPLPVYDTIEQLSRQAGRMVRESLDAFLRNDADLARRVRTSDDDVDDACDSILQQVSHLMAGDSSKVEAGLLVLRATQNLERIGDLATNIAKDVIFLVDGAIVRHGGRKA